ALQRARRREEVIAVLERVSRAQRSAGNTMEDSPRCAADTDLGFTRDRLQMCASRASPTCVDRYGLWRTRISDAPLRCPSRCIASGTWDITLAPACGPVCRSGNAEARRDRCR